jgi:O-acetyl-ADP-ribose deacetylase (regulator of RNase III)
MDLKTKNIETMLRELIEVNGLDLAIPKVEEMKEDLLKTLMTISMPAKLSCFYYEAEEIYLMEQKKNKHTVLVEDITEKLIENVYIFKGDITSVKADSIVNAANEKLLGCFIPGHHCIDNAIHMAAGLGLRNACNLLMEIQGHDEKVGQAKVTGGFNIPSKYVVHTVGPNVNGIKPLTMNEVIEQLRSCYLSVLREINNYEDIRNVVFCSISTGVYGVPIELASKVALTTIKEYLEKENHHLDKVIIDVFSKEDYNEYKRKSVEIREKL